MEKKNDDKLVMITSENDVDRIENEILRSGEGSGNGSGSGGGSGSGEGSGGRQEETINLDAKESNSKTAECGNFKTICKAVARASVKKITENGNVSYELDSCSCTFIAGTTPNTVPTIIDGKSVDLVYRVSAYSETESPLGNLGHTISCEEKKISCFKMNPDNTYTDGTVTVSASLLVNETSISYIDINSITLQ